MSGPTVTVRHHEDAVEEVRLCSHDRLLAAPAVDAEVTYPVGQHAMALDAVDRLAADLRRQIADAAESAR